MRILVINTVPYFMNGITSVIMNYYKELKDEVSFDFIINDFIDPEIESLIEKDSKLFLLPNRKKYPISYVRKLKIIVRKNDYDVIHIHGNSSLMSIELFALNKHNTDSIIVHNHSVKSDYPILSRLCKRYFEKSNYFAVAASKEAGEWLFKDRNYHVIQNGMDISNYTFSESKRLSLRKKLGIRSETIILNVGRYNEPKNKKFVIDTFIEYLKFDKSAKLILIGTGNEQNKIKEYVAMKKINSSILFIDKTTDMQGYYSASDIFSFPSKWESLGMVVVEAQIAALPSLVSDTVPYVTNVSDYITFYSIENEKNGRKKCMI